MSTQPYAGLLERLVLKSARPWSEGLEVRNNPDGPEAAEAISSLLNALVAIRSCYPKNSNAYRIAVEALNSDAYTQTVGGDR